MGSRHYDKPTVILQFTVMLSTSESSKRRSDIIQQEGDISYCIFSVIDITWLHQAASSRLTLPWQTFKSSDPTRQNSTKPAPSILSSYYQAYSIKLLRVVTSLSSLFRYQVFRYQVSFGIKSLSVSNLFQYKVSLGIMSLFQVFQDVHQLSLSDSSLSFKPYPKFSLLFKL